jgi:BlaI family penicillinase repressor
MDADRDRDAGAGISEAEWQVMQVLWERAPRTSAEVAEALAAVTGWHPKTVQTLIGRLVKKGAVSYDAEGSRYLYRPAVSRHAAVRAEGRSFLERVFGGDARELLFHFAGEAELTAAEAAELRRLLDAHEERAGRSPASGSAEGTEGAGNGEGAVHAGGEAGASGEAGR